MDCRFPLKYICPWEALSGSGKTQSLASLEAVPIFESPGTLVGRECSPLRCHHRQWALELLCVGGAPRFQRNFRALFRLHAWNARSLVSQNLSPEDDAQTGLLVV